MGTPCLWAKPRDRIAAYRGAMKQLQFLIKPAAGYCNMRCQYCFYRDEQQNRVNPDDCMMSFTTAETLIQRCFAEIEQGGYISFAFQGGEPTLAGLDFFRFFTQTVQKYNQKRVTVQYAIQTNGLAVTEEWAEFFSKEHFLVGISLDGTPDVHDALRPDTQETEHGIKLRRRLNCCTDTAWSAIFCVSSPNGWPKSGARI